MIIVSTQNASAEGVNLDALFGLSAAPYPGDQVRLPDGRMVLVIRRTHNAKIDGDDSRPDLELKVRLR